MLIKKSIIFILIILITLSPVYSISLLPKQQSNIYSNFKIIKVLYDKQYTSQVYLESITSKIIDGFQITVKYENSQDTITIYNQLDSYSTKQYSFKVNQLNPSSLEIRSITNNNHKLVFSTPLTYTFTGNEQPIQEQQPSITTIQQQEQQLVNNPQYISYTSISKLDNNKDIVYFTKDHISSNRITTNQQGDIEYQANYQPYGDIFTQEGNEKYKFSGKELDSSNLYYFGARYYDPSIGRFTQVDPIFKLDESPYMYANNNPIKYIDPTGKILKISQEICDYLCDIGVDPEYLLQSSPTLKRLDERQEMFTFSYPQSEEDFMEIYENGPWGFVLDKSTTAIINPDETQDPARLIGTIIHEGSHLLGNAEKTSAWERESELPTDLNYVFYYLEEMRASKASARELQKLRNNPKFERINFEQVITAQAIYHSAMGVELIQLSSKPTKIKNLNTINFNIAYTMLRHQYVDPSLLFIAAANGYNPLIALNKGDTDSWRDLMK